jgi:hypothetical protein
LIIHKFIFIARCQRIRLDVHGTQYAAHDGTKDRRGNGATVVFTRLRIVDNNNQREARLTRRRNTCGISNVFVDVAAIRPYFFAVPVLMAMR